MGAQCCSEPNWRSEFSNELNVPRYSYPKRGRSVEPHTKGASKADDIFEEFNVEDQDPKKVDSL